MERIIDIDIKQHALKRVPLIINQYAYQAGKPTETALHFLTTRIEKTIADKEISVVSFIDIEGAFANTSFSSIKRAASDFGIDSQIICWITAMANLTCGRLKTVLKWEISHPPLSHWL